MQHRCRARGMHRPAGAGLYSPPDAQRAIDGPVPTGGRTGHVGCSIRRGSEIPVEGSHCPAGDRKSRGGSIINTGSSAGMIGIPKCNPYTSAKGGTVSLTRSMAVEFGPTQIRTNCIRPAAIATPMVEESNLSNPELDEKAFLEHGTPLRRRGQPEDITQTALFLASDDASYPNGAIIVADGGITVL